MHLLPNEHYVADNNFVAKSSKISILISLGCETYKLMFKI